MDAMLKLAIIVVALGLGGFLANAQELDDDYDDLDDPKDSHKVALRAVLTSIDKVHEEFTSLTTKFLQIKHLALLTEPVRNEGWFYFSKPDKMCWEYGEPDPLVMWINSDNLTMYYPDLKKAEVLDISNFKGRMQQAMGFGQSSKVLRKYYRIQLQSEFQYDPTVKERPQFIPPDFHELAQGNLDKPLDLAYLELLPKKRSIQKRIEKVSLWINKETWLPQCIQYEQANGDRSTMFLKEVYRDQPIPAEKFERTLPPDVAIKKMKRSAKDN